MPVVIDELEVNVSIQNSNSSRGNGSGNSSASSNTDNKMQVMEACLEKIMEVINHKKER